MTKQFLFLKGQWSGTIMSLLSPFVTANYNFIHQQHSVPVYGVLRSSPDPISAAAACSELVE